MKESQYTTYKITDLQKETEYTYVKSPFLYKEGLNYKCFNQKVNCTYEEIHTLRVKGLINNKDWDIINALYKYRFLNRHSIERYLDISKKNGIKKSLNKLVEQGIVLRFYFYIDLEDGENQETPYFYTLSKGTHIFLKKSKPFETLIDKSGTYELPEVTNILNRLVFNQFHINFMQQYNDKIVKDKYYENIKIKGYEFNLEGYFKLKYKTNSGFNMFDLVVLPIRRNPHWEKEFILRLTAIYQYASKPFNTLNEPIIMVICEDDIQAKEAFYYKECSQSTRKIYTLYTSDISLVTSNILSNLYYCELAEDMKETSIKTNIIDIDKQDGHVIFDLDEVFAQKHSIQNRVKISIRNIDI